MRITPKQKEVLDNLVCQRLTADPENKRLIRNFYSANGIRLVEYLKYYAWEEDQEGSTAFYIIKNRRNQILMFFSLKCGALFDPLIEDEIRDRIAAYNEVLTAIRAARNSGDQNRVLEQAQVSSFASLSQLERNLRDNILTKQDTLKEINRDRIRESNEKIVRVGETHPGIELVHFCVNDDARNFWRRSGVGRPMGEVLFWRFVAPIIYNVQKAVGCKYVYLFAADLSPDRSLVNYYQYALNFELPVELGTSKPRYDFQCEFMCQKTSDLRSYRRSYFANFNPDPAEFV